MASADPNTTTEPAAQWAQRALWVAVLVGIALRVREYLAVRSLWLDEVFLALGILDQPWQDLLQPLPHNQIAAIGFVVVTKAIAGVLGPAEWALRLLPCLAGLASVVLCACVATKVLPRWGAALATLLFSLSDRGIYYATEFKPYSVDVLASLVALYWGLSRPPCSRTRRLADALLLGTVLLFSFPAALVIVASGIYRLIRATDRKQELRYLGLIALACAPAALIAYLGGGRHATANRFLYDYWAFAFPRIPPVSLEDLRWYVWTTRSLIEHAFDAWSYSLVAALAGYGMLRMRHGGLLALALVVTFAAAAVRLYPFHGRTVLFLSPVVCYATCAGLTHLGKQRWRGLLLVAGAILLTVPPAVVAYGFLWRSRERAPAREMFALLSRVSRSRPQQLAVTTWAAGFMYDYYGRLFSLPRRQAVEMPEWNGDRVSYRQSLLRALKGKQATWVVYYGVVDWRHGPIEAVYEETEALLEALESDGSPTVLFAGPGTLLIEWHPREESNRRSQRQ